jgi:hypothetical protein
MARTAARIAFNVYSVLENKNPDHPWRPLKHGSRCELVKLLRFFRAPASAGAPLFVEEPSVIFAMPTDYARIARSVGKVLSEGSISEPLPHALSNCCAIFPKVTAKPDRRRHAAAKRSRAHS